MTTISFCDLEYSLYLRYRCSGTILLPILYIKYLWFLSFLEMCKTTRNKVDSGSMLSMNIMKILNQQYICRVQINYFPIILHLQNQ
jgi:hypothetical protein